MKTSKRLILGVTASILLAGSFFITGCGSKTNPTSANPGPSGTPVYSTSAVTVVNGGGSFYPSGICYSNINGNLWLIVGLIGAGPWALDEYTTAGASITAISTFNGSGNFNNPICVNDGPDGTVYVADTNNTQIEVFSSSGTYQTVITGFSGLMSVAVNSASTTLYALDNSSPISILTYSITGTTSKTFNSTGSFSTTGSGIGALNNPWYMVLDSNNNVYVTDKGNGNIVKYGPTGANPVSFGSPLLTSPTGIAVDSSGNVLAIQYPNPCFIQEFTLSGSTYTAGVTFGGSILNDSLDLALDGSNNLYVANYLGHQILEFKNTN